MSDKSAFSDQEWIAVTEAPLEVMVTMFAAGQHGPISMVKESTAGAKAITNPGNRGAASALIAEIVPLAQSKQARHDVGHPKGGSLEQIISACLAKLEPAATALRKLPDDEGSQVGAWLVGIGAAVAGASKGVSDTERDTLGKIAAILGVSPPEI